MRRNNDPSKQRPNIPFTATILGRLLRAVPVGIRDARRNTAPPSDSALSLERNYSTSSSTIRTNRRVRAGVAGQPYPSTSKVRRIYMGRDRPC